MRYVNLIFTSVTLILTTLISGLFIFRVFPLQEVMLLGSEYNTHFLIILSAIVFSALHPFVKFICRSLIWGGNTNH